MLDIDRFKTAELDGMDPSMYVHLLNELCGEIKRLGDDKERALDIQADAKIALCDDPKDAGLKKTKLHADRVVAKLTCAISTRREQAKIVQTQYNNAVRLAH
jgi:hypothetical protein